MEMSIPKEIHSEKTQIVTLAISSRPYGRPIFGRDGWGLLGGIVCRSNMHVCIYPLSACMAADEINTSGFKQSAKYQHLYNVNCFCSHTTVHSKGFRTKHNASAINNNQYLIGCNPDYVTYITNAWPVRL